MFGLVLVELAIILDYRDRFDSLKHVEYGMNICDESQGAFACGCWRMRNGAPDPHRKVYPEYNPKKEGPKP